MTRAIHFYMRIEQTGQILKDSRVARHSHETANDHERNMVSRAWKAMTELPKRIIQRNHEGNDR